MLSKKRDQRLKHTRDHASERGAFLVIGALLLVAAALFICGWINNRGRQLQQLIAAQELDTLAAGTAQTMAAVADLQGMAGMLQLGIYAVDGFLTSGYSLAAVAALAERRPEIAILLSLQGFTALRSLQQVQQQLVEAVDSTMIILPPLFFFSHSIPGTMVLPLRLPNMPDPEDQEGSVCASQQPEDQLTGGYLGVHTARLSLLATLTTAGWSLARGAVDNGLNRLSRKENQLLNGAIVPIEEAWKSLMSDVRRRWLDTLDSLANATLQPPADRTIMLKRLARITRSASRAGEVEAEAILVHLLPTDWNQRTAVPASAISRVERAVKSIRQSLIQIQPSLDSAGATSQAPGAIVADILQLLGTVADILPDHHSVVTYVYAQVVPTPENQDRQIQAGLAAAVPVWSEMVQSLKAHGNSRIDRLTQAGMEALERLQLQVIGSMIATQNKVAESALQSGWRLLCSLTSALHVKVPGLPLPAPATHLPDFARASRFTLLRKTEYGWLVAGGGIRSSHQFPLNLVPDHSGDLVPSDRLEHLSSGFRVPPFLRYFLFSR